MHKFLNLATFAKWTNDQTCFFFGLHLHKGSYTWFSNLPDNIAKNFDKLKEQFIASFGLNGATKWSVLPDIYDMKQRTDQPVQDFIQKVQMKSKLIDLPEDQVIGALMKGFLPQIRSDLIRAEINNTADVIREATISEQANKIKNATSDSILSEERLIKAIQTAMSINHLQTEKQPDLHLKPPSQKPPFQSRTQQQQNYRRPQYQTHAAQNTSYINSNYICIRRDKKVTITKISVPL